MPPMARRPYIQHYICHVSHVKDWPKHAKVWIAWGSMGWRPGVVFSHRENRVAVRVVDGRWPFGPGGCRRAPGLAFVAPNSLRARRGPEPPSERATGLLPCLDMVAPRDSGNP